MRPSYKQNEEELAKLQTRYRTAWRHFSGEVRRWQMVQAERPGDALSLRTAETAAHLAEKQYRQARNAFADYLLEHSSQERESLLVNFR